MKPLYIVLIVVVVLVVIGFIWRMQTKSNSIQTCRTAQGAEGTMTVNGCVPTNSQNVRMEIQNGNSRTVSNINPQNKVTLTCTEGFSLQQTAQGTFRCINKNGETKDPIVTVS